MIIDIILLLGSIELNKYLQYLLTIKYSNINLQMGALNMV
jgi:hypothetical protein